MKYTLTVLILSFNLSVSSQNFWSSVYDTQEHNKSRYVCDGIFNDSIVLISGYVDLDHCPVYNLSAYNLRGTQLWSIDGHFDVIYTDSNSIYTVGFENGGDTPGYEYLSISKLDGEGNIIFQSEYPETPHEGFWFRPTSLDVNPNGEILISSANSILKADMDGKIISETPLDLQQDVRQIRYLSKNSLIITSTHRIYKTDSSYAVLDSIDFGEQFITQSFQSDTLYCLLSNHLLKIDTNLSIIDTIFVSDDFQIKDMIVSGENIWVMESRGDVVKLVFCQNSLITDSYEFKSLMEISGFVLSDSILIFTGTTTSHQTALYGYDLKLPTQEIHLPDIEIIDFEIDNVEVTYETLGSTGTFPIYYHFDAKIVVKNNSNLTVNSFALYANFLGGFNCGNNNYYEVFSDYALLPNEEIVITPMRKLNQDYHGGSSNICFECLAPNSSLESNYDNNTICKTYFPVSINQPERLEQINVFPNPTNDVLELKHEISGYKSIRIHDMGGKLLYYNITSDSKSIIDISSFNIGIYSLSITTSNETINLKIIKE